MQKVAMTWPMFQRRQCRIGDTLHQLGNVQVGVLALLLVRGPAWVSSAEIIEFTYGDREPDSALSDCISAIMRLRRRGVPILNEHGRGFMIPAAARP